MPQERTRDKVWKFALTRAIRNERAVEPSYIVELTGASERTVRETLNVMADCGWLKRDVQMDGTVRFLGPDDVKSSAADF